MLVIVSLPKPKDPPICYISLFVSEIHGESDGKVLVDFPVTLDHRERRWIPKNITTPL